MPVSTNPTNFEIIILSVEFNTTFPMLCPIAANTFVLIVFTVSTGSSYLSRDLSIGYLLSAILDMFKFSSAVVKTGTT